MKIEPYAVYSPEEVGRIMGLNVKRVYELLNQNRIPAKREGRKYFIFGSQLIKYFESEE